jgi:YD repeat-containing protein
VTHLTFTVADLTGITDADNAAWGYSYDSSNRLLTITNPRNYTITFTYNAGGWVTSDSRPTGSALAIQAQATYTDGGAVLAEDPPFLAAWLGLADLCLEQGRRAEVEQIIGHLHNGLGAPLEAAVTRARLLLAQKEFAAAEKLLREIISDHPRALWPRVILSHALLQEGRDLAAAEQALQDILALDPQHIEARRNLTVLRRQWIATG